MENIIINNYYKTQLKLTPAAVERLKLYAPAGCPFTDYNFLDLLIDLIKMYSWKMEKGRNYKILDFLALTNDAHAIIYKSAFAELLKGAPV